MLNYLFLSGMIWSATSLIKLIYRLVFLKMEFNNISSESLLKYSFKSSNKIFRDLDSPFEIYYF